MNLDSMSWDGLGWVWGRMAVLDWMHGTGWGLERVKWNNPPGQNCFRYLSGSCFWHLLSV